MHEIYQISIERVVRMMPWSLFNEHQDQTENLVLVLDWYFCLGLWLYEIQLQIFCATQD